ncbi:DUF262 domain-containing protein [Desulforhopalus vacuolatus]|nr:DUF262 domain-containing protein [Desulforhopalus vacuolatus]
MAGSTFKTNPYYLHELLENCHRGILQLPDFQRSWVWDEDRIKSLIASISRALLDSSNKCNTFASEDFQRGVSNLR